MRCQTDCRIVLTAKKYSKRKICTKKSMQQPRKSTTLLPRFCSKKSTATCAYRTYWTRAAWRAALSMPTTKPKRICSNPFAPPFSGMYSPTHWKRSKATTSPNRQSLTTSTSSRTSSTTCTTKKTSSTQSCSRKARTLSSTSCAAS